MARPQVVQFAGTGGVPLVASAFGAPGAAPVVLLHGGGQTRHAWGGTGAALGAAGFRAYAIDLRGHGDSAWAADGDYRLETHAADVRAIAAQVGGRPAAVGASLGGLAAMLAEGECPVSILSAMVLVDIAPRTEPAGVERIVGFMTAHPDGFASLEEAADAVAAYQPHRPRPKDYRGLAKNLRQGPDGRWRWHWDPRMMTGERRMNATRDPGRLERAVARTRVPTLLVRGRLSDVVSEEGARHFLEIVPHARYVDVSAAGHMIAGDRNDPFTAAVVEFLSAVRRGG